MNQNAQSGGRDGETAWRRTYDQELASSIHGQGAAA